MANSTSPVPQVVEGTNAVKKINEVLDMASQAMIGGRDASTTSLLTWGYLGGRVSSADKASGTVALTASATNYVVMAKAGLAVSASTATTNWNDATNYWRLYSVVTSATAATSYSDERFGTAGLFGVGGSGGGGFSNPMTTIGDVIYGGAAGVATRLGIGTTAYVFTSNGAGVAPSWQASAAGFTNPMTTAGDLIYGGTAGVATRLAIGSNTQVLTLTGGLPTWATPGGASLTNWTESVTTAAPNATIPAVRFLATNAATHADAVISPKGTSGALLAQVPDNTTAGGDKRGIKAVDFQMSRSASTGVAAGDYSFIGGGQSNRASTSNATVAGGSSNVASGVASACVGGTGNTISGSYSSVSGGSTNTASGDYSFIPGGFQATTRGLYGCKAHSSGQITALGDAQSSDFVLRRATSDATLSGLSADGTAPGAATGITLPNSSTYTFDSIIVARSGATGDSASFRIVGAIKRGASAGTTALLGAPTITAIGADAGASAWTVVAVANTTLGSLEFRVTGVAATNIRWVASVSTVECVV